MKVDAVEGFCVLTIRWIACLRRPKTYLLRLNGHPVFPPPTSHDDPRLDSEKKTQRHRAGSLFIQLNSAPIKAFEEP